MNDNRRVKILENYNNYEPPKWVLKTVSRLVNGIPKNYLNGLKIISLSNTEGLNHRRRRQKTYSRKRKVAIQECRGLYYQKWQKRSAYIELFVDKIIQDCPAIIILIPFFKDLIFSEIIYHELGHHIHKTNAPEYKEREDVAEVWKNRLKLLYFRDRYFYSKLVFVPLMILTRAIIKLLRIIQRSLKTVIPART